MRMLMPSIKKKRKKKKEKSIKAEKITQNQNRFRISMIFSLFLIFLFFISVYLFACLGFHFFHLFGISFLIFFCALVLLLLLSHWMLSKLMLLRQRLASELRGVLANVNGWGWDGNEEKKQQHRIEMKTEMKAKWERKNFSFSLH